MALAAFLASAAATPAATADSGADETLAHLVHAIGARQDLRVAEALPKIDGTGRRLLALRSYLRARPQLSGRWSWTQGEIDAYVQSPEHLAREQEIERVRAAFARESPGFELWVNPQVRSLDVQIANWNDSESVSLAAENLQASARQLITSPGFPAAAPEQALLALENFLTTYVPEPIPAVAAPGLSPHGQMRAVDFQVTQGGHIVAGPKAATIATDWDAAGWSAKLDAAVRAASSRFVGPLETPREPWHYTYTPEAVAAQ